MSLFRCGDGYHDRDRSGKAVKGVVSESQYCFVTGYDKYMAQAIELRMSGYVTKPATKEKILIELEDLKHPVTPPEKYESFDGEVFWKF